MLNRAMYENTGPEGHPVLEVVQDEGLARQEEE